MYNGLCWSVEQLCRQIFIDYKEKTADKRKEEVLPPEFSNSLFDLFGDTAVDALHIIDKNRVCLLSCAAEKQLYQIDEQHNLWTIFPKVNFCLCDTFRDQVLENRRQLTCKHVLAVWIAEAIGRVEKRNVPDDAMVQKIATFFDSTS